MNKVIFVGFDTEQQADEGDCALHDMHRDGTLTLYNDAVVVKERIPTRLPFFKSWRQNPDGCGIRINLSHRCLG
jgi:hypothetical protein